MNIPDVHEEKIDIPGLGVKKLEWLSRAVMAKDEIHHNLILHIYHVQDENFPAMMEQAWVKSGIMDQGITCELSYTDEYEGYEIDAYDAIFFKVDPMYAKAHKDMFVRALVALYQERTNGLENGRDESGGSGVRGTSGKEVPKMQQNSNRQEGPQDE